MPQLLPKILNLSEAAGQKIMEIYRQADVQVTYKTDRSPVTDADHRANEIICEGLERYAPGIDILSEESKLVSYQERKDWRQFWLIDPLDGTKEFIRKGKNFTVNIALIDHGAPIMGVIYAPFTGELFYGARNLGAFKKPQGKEAQPISVRKLDKNTLSAVVSHRHASDEMRLLKQKWPEIKIDHASSSIKFCMVAEGQFDMYMRTGPTHEWDIAAGHAILEAAGGTMTDLKGEPLAYNKERLNVVPFLGGSSRDLIEDFLPN